LQDINEYKTFHNVFKDNNGTEAGKIPYNSKLDVLRWSHKVFALTEKAFKLAEDSKEAGWLVWIDADTYFKKRLTKEDVLFMLPEGADIVLDQEDTSFVAFNLNKQPALDILGDLRGTYISGEVLNYREWHDGFIFQRLLNIYSSHGMKIHTTSIMKNYMIHFKGNYDPTKLSIRNSKGERVFKLSNDTSPDVRPNRYKQIIDVINQYKPVSFIETGTWNGGRVIEMALTAFEYSDTVNYTGYDLFEDATVETDQEENNVKAHNKISAVQKRLEEFAKHVKENKNKTFNFKLVKGNTRETLTKSQADFALIGGGNSTQTVQHDYDCLNTCKIIMLDHFFRKDESKNIPDSKYQGVNKVYKKIKDKKIRKLLLPSGDMVLGGGFTHLVLIISDPKLEEPNDQLKQVPIVVNPRDCVPKDYIRDNIKSNMKIINKNKWIGKYKLHKDTGIIVSGGPHTDYDELRSVIKENPNSKLMCVKHSYPHLLKENIIPWACIVLDPRPITGTSTHGVLRKTLFEKIELKTKFFIASMTDPSVTKYLQENNADIWGWHAFTESLRDPEEQKKGIQNNQVKLNDTLGIPQGATLITGGTCAAMRSIGMMHTMGFRDLHLFGFDCCLKEEPTKEMKKETTGAEDEEPRPKYFQVAVKNKPYWTTGELLAMAQDCERTFNEDSMGIYFTFHGKNTLAADLWSISNEQDKLQPYEDFFNVQ
jgi:hypothetical protein